MVQMFVWRPTHTEEELFYCGHSRHKGEKKEPCLDVQGSILLEGSSALTVYRWAEAAHPNVAPWSGPHILLDLMKDELEFCRVEVPRSALEVYELPLLNLCLRPSHGSISHPPNPPFFFFPHYHLSPVSLPLLFIMPSISSRLMPSGVLPSFWNMDHQLHCIKCRKSTVQH